MYFIHQQTRDGNWTLIKKIPKIKDRKKPKHELR